MSEHEAIAASDVLKKIEELASKSSKTLGVARGVLLLVISVAVLCARFEFRQNDHEKRISNSEQDTKELRTTTYSVVSDVAGIKGRLGITRVEIPKRALQAWKGEEAEPPQQQ